MRMQYRIAQPVLTGPQQDDIQVLKHGWPAGCSSLVSMRGIITTKMKSGTALRSCYGIGLSVMQLLHVVAVLVQWSDWKPS
jgi:hypothetical protein